MNRTGDLSALIDLDVSGAGIVAVVAVGVVLYALARIVRTRLRRMPLSATRRALVRKTETVVEVVATVAFVVTLRGKNIAGKPGEGAPVQPFTP